MKQRTVDPCFLTVALFCALAPCGVLSQEVQQPGADGRTTVPGSSRFFRIEVVDQQSKWPVPLVELRTTHGVRFVTDNAGVIAFDLPELWGKETWFDVLSPGYAVPKDGFGFRGVRLTPKPGTACTVEVVRTSLAKRIGRLTGGGLFGESQKLGENLDWHDAGILGCDSIQLAEHKGRLFWAWGDTTKANYPLGIFDMTSATTGLRPLTSFVPPLKLRLDYFTDSQGVPRGVAKLPGPGPTWLSGYVSLPDASGKPRLVASYAKIRPPMDAYERGLCVWDDETSSFKPHRLIWSETNSPAGAKSPPIPEGHPVFWQDGDQKVVLFGNPFPTLRCPATFEAWSNPAEWRVLKPQAVLVSADGGEEVKPHSGSIAWRPYRKKWVAVFMQFFGKPSAFGELWYAEADSPIGPWGKAVKILSHENYTFYNPRLQPELTAADSSVLLFEGTYTAEFADHPQVTPRYNYNQILYRLDLDDPGLVAALKR